ncbi:MAG: hypothetical protein IPO57_15890 [Rhodocyclales bacterium]|nr:hypothetical protein [Rhodocyclales bacterium]
MTTPIRRLLGEYGARRRGRDRRLGAASRERTQVLAAVGFLCHTAAAENAGRPADRFRRRAVRF